MSRHPLLSDLRPVIKALERHPAELADVRLCTHYGIFVGPEERVRPMVLALLIGTIGCSTSPVSAPAIEDPAPIVETHPPEFAGFNTRYTLILVNGSLLPSKSPIGAGEWDYDGAQYELVSASLAFNPDGRFVESWIHRRTTGGSLIRQDFIGQYSGTSDTTFRLSPASTIATLTTNGLVWRMGNFTLTYELTK